MQPLFILLDCWAVIGSIGTAIAAGAAVVYTFLTYRLLQTNQDIVRSSQETLRKTIKAYYFQTYVKLSDILCGTKGSALFNLIKTNELVIDESVAGIEGKKATSEYIRENLLGPLEDASVFLKDDHISIEMIDNGFGYLILETGSNPPILNYLKKLRTTYKDAYSGFLELYKEVHKICNDANKRYLTPDELMAHIQ